MKGLRALAAEVVARTSPPLVVGRVAAWDYVTRGVLNDPPVLAVLTADLRSDLDEQAHLQAVRITGGVQVTVNEDHAEAWVRDLRVLLMEAECVDLPHRAVRSRWRRGRVWAADRAARVRRVFEP